ncbi:MAG: helix-turn-helix domain-containing protein [Candidatus Acidiferrales bacterium]
MGKLLKAIEVAARLAVSEKMIYKLAKLGRLPAVRFGSAVRFDEDDVEAFITASKSGKIVQRRAA